MAAMMAAAEAYSRPVWMPSVKAVAAVALTGPPAWMARANEPRALLARAAGTPVSWRLLR